MPGRVSSIQVNVVLADLPVAKIIKNRRRQGRHISLFPWADDAQVELAAECAIGHQGDVSNFSAWSADVLDDAAESFSVIGFCELFS